MHVAAFDVRVCALQLSMATSLSVKPTVPVDRPTLLPDGLGVTVAVNVTDWLIPDGLVGLARAMLVVPGATAKPPVNVPNDAE